jgi:fatty acid desaturase
MPQVPFESWRTTHRLHHKNTGNIDKDEIYYPNREVNALNYAKKYIVGTLPIAWCVPSISSLIIISDRL